MTTIKKAKALKGRLGAHFSIAFSANCWRDQG